MKTAWKAFMLATILPVQAFAEGGGHGSAGEFTLGDAVTHPNFLGSVVNFVLLLFILGYAVKKMGNPKLAERRAEIESSLREAQELKAAAAAKHDEYKKRLEKLDAEIDTLRADMVKAGEAERDRIVAEAEEKAARIRKDTSFVIEQQMKQLRQDLSKEAVAAAVESAERLLATGTQEADQDRLAQSYLGRLDELAAKSGGRA